MDQFIKGCNYLFDFHKVRAFQEFCGLKPNYDKQELQAKLSNNYNKLDQNYKEKNVVENNVKYHESFSQTEDLSCDYSVHNWPLYYIFRFGSFLGQETFYITFLPFVFWNFDAGVARKMVLVWVITMYIGQALKDLLKLPRPTSPPTFKLEKRVQAEYGLPSTHAIAGTTLPFSMILSSYQQFNISLTYGILFSICWCLLVSSSRIYVGMHSILDVLAGITIAAIYLVFGWPFVNMVEDYTFSIKYSPWLIVTSHFLLGYFYPAPKRYSTTRGDTVIILGAGAGIQVASWILFQYSIDLSPHRQFTDLNIFLNIHFWLISILRFTLGIILVFTVRLTIKKLVLIIICHVFGVSLHDKHTHRRKEIEVTYKFVTYFSVGFVVVVMPFFIDTFITF